MTAFEKAIDDHINEQRKARFINSPQWNLGQLIDAIERAGIVYAENKSKEVCFDFGTAEPTRLGSWRGDYSELALGYSLSGYSDKKNHFGRCTADKLLECLSEAENESMTGWKGGDFIMTRATPLWVANSGDCGNTAVVGLLDKGYGYMVILTCYLEY